MVEDSFKIDSQRNRKELPFAADIKSLRIALVAGIKQSALGPRGSVPRDTVRRASDRRFKVSTPDLADTLERRQAGGHFRLGVPAELSGPHQ